ncbi:TPA_asm: hypothetical protein GNB58_004897 [Salmonella enterica subsp. houtenae serovar 45:g,z51:-]|uniref:DUF6645 domain-containing protein n=1 Tax=Salmonella enterica subsp. houtenae serovar 45:g,z51:- TaxID=1967611 RepID=A0A736RDB6_SALHO|nr:hypothetical protein [Salmonella enterica subsp. houtenae str. CFSAN000557]HAE7767770.1 hypothetical protein [Salmonella enterica subsp. houtenae serovar 45:g,z51:-]
MSIRCGMLTSASAGVVSGGSKKTLIPGITSLGYNGRRGDGSLPSQGWAQITGGTFTPVAQVDGHGGWYLHVVKNSNAIWEVRQPVSDRPGDLIRYGGRLFCRFRLSGTVAEGRYAFAFYLKVSASEIPPGVTLFDDGSAEMSPTLMNFAVITKGGNISLCQHRGAKSGDMVEVANWGRFDNEWHTMELIYPGDNGVMVTPVLDGEKKSPVSLSLSRALVDQDIILLSSITKSTVYSTDVASFEGEVYRDNGEYTLSPTDNGNHYFFPAGYHRGRVIIPDAVFPQGFSVEISAQGALVTVHPESDTVLLQPKDIDEGYPTDVVIGTAVRLIQTGTDGKTWVIV